MGWEASCTWGESIDEHMRDRRAGRYIAASKAETNQASLHRQRLLPSQWAPTCFCLPRSWDARPALRAGGSWGRRLGELGHGANFQGVGSEGRSRASSGGARGGIRRFPLWGPAHQTPSIESNAAANFAICPFSPERQPSKGPLAQVPPEYGLGTSARRRLQPQEPGRGAVPVPYSRIAAAPLVPLLVRWALAPVTLLHSGSQGAARVRPQQPQHPSTACAAPITPACLAGSRTVARYCTGPGLGLLCGRPRAPKTAAGH